MSAWIVWVEGAYGVSVTNVSAVSIEDAVRHCALYRWTSRTSYYAGRDGDEVVWCAGINDNDDDVPSAHQRFKTTNNGQDVKIYDENDDDMTDEERTRAGENFLALSAARRAAHAAPVTDIAACLLPIEHDGPCRIRKMLPPYIHEPAYVALLEEYRSGARDLHAVHAAFDKARERWGFSDTSGFVEFAKTYGKEITKKEALEMIAEWRAAWPELLREQELADAQRRAQAITEMAAEMTEDEVRALPIRDVPIRNDLAPKWLCTCSGPHGKRHPFEPHEADCALMADVRKGIR